MRCEVISLRWVRVVGCGWCVGGVGGVGVVVGVVVVLLWFFFVFLFVFLVCGVFCVLVF